MIQNKTHTVTATWYLTNMSKTYIGKKSDSLTNYIGKSWYLHVQEWHQSKGLWNFTMVEVFECKWTQAWWHEFDPSTPKWSGENLLLRVVLWHPHVCHGSWAPPPIHVHASMGTCVCMVVYIHTIKDKNQSKWAKVKGIWVLFNFYRKTENI